MSFYFHKITIFMVLNGGICSQQCDVSPLYRVLEHVHQISHCQPLLGGTLVLTGGRLHYSLIGDAFLFPKGSGIFLLSSYMMSTWFHILFSYIQCNFLDLLYFALPQAQATYLLTNGNKTHSQFTERSSTSSPPYCLNKKEDFTYNIVKVHIAKQVRSKNYSYNI